MKKNLQLLCIALLSIISINAYSQNFYQPIVGGDGNGSETIKGIAGMGGETVFVTGVFTSPSFQPYTGLPTLANNGESNIFVAAYAPQGNMLWAKAPINGTGHDTVSAIVKDDMGDLYIVGYFTSVSLIFDSFTLNNADVSGTTYDIFIAKYSHDGNLIWAKREGGIGDEMATDIAIDGSDNLYIAGNYTSPSLQLGSTPIINNNGAGSDIFYARYDTTGVAIWAFGAGNFMDDYAKAIAVDWAGNVYVTGSILSPSITFGTTTINNIGNENFYIAAFDNAGTFQWAHGAGTNSTGTNRATDIVVDQNGDVYLTGYYNSATLTGDGGSFGPLNNNSIANDYDIFTLKYHADGSIGWAQSVGSNRNEYAYALSVDQCGYVYVWGTHSSDFNFAFGANSGINVSAGHRAFLLLKYKDNGTPLNAKDFSVGHTHPTAISGDIDGNIVIAGSFDTTTVYINSANINNHDASGLTSDYFITKWQTTPTDIYATVMDGTTPVNNGWVYLYARKGAYGSLDYGKLKRLDSVHLMGTNIAHFAGVLNLNYCVIAKADTLLYPNLIPTYNDNKYLWDEVITWAHTCNANDSVTINMMHDSLVVGAPGKVNGYVTKTDYYGIGASGVYNGSMNRDIEAQGDPVPDATIRIRHNPGGGAMATTPTDVNGMYAFDNLPPGDYTVMVDMPGLGRDLSYDISITSLDTLFNLLNYCVDSDYVQLCNFSVNVPAHHNNNQEITITPNPATNEFKVSSSKLQVSEIRIYNVLGEIIHQSTINNQQSTIDVSHFEDGIYFVEITDANKNRVNKKLVISH